MCQGDKSSNLSRCVPGQIDKEDRQMDGLVCRVSAQSLSFKWRVPPRGRGLALAHLEAKLLLAVTLQPEDGVNAERYIPPSGVAGETRVFGPTPICPL